MNIYAQTQAMNGTAGAYADLYAAGTYLKEEVSSTTGLVSFDPNAVLTSSAYGGAGASSCGSLRRLYSAAALSSRTSCRQRPT